jgi:hypothetical protein
MVPGDEGRSYALNPGEGFAEAFRVTNEARAGATEFDWPIVSPLFMPDEAARRAIEDDVLRPWSAPAVVRVAGTLSGNRRAWTRTIATPLDGELALTLRLPRPRLYDVTVLSADRKTVLARSRWSSTTEKTLGFTVCGERSVLVRVTRTGPAGRFSLRIERP